MVEQFRVAGLTVSEDAFPAGGRLFCNIVGRLRRITAPQEEVLVVAHDDTKPGTPGADDNASAVEATIETARTRGPMRFDRTLQFVGFTLEEYGCLGSRRFARRARREEREIVGVLDLEMVGFTSRRQRVPLRIRARTTGDFTGVVGDRRSRMLVEAFAALARRTTPFLPVESLVVEWNGYLLPIVRLGGSRVILGRRLACGHDHRHCLRNESSGFSGKPAGGDYACSLSDGSKPMASDLTYGAAPGILD